MSMPNFPEGILNITCNQAFNMLLGSIAMEELALSHILNAEGEKLQYILGTLPGKPSSPPTPQEVIQVNRSISELLELVAYNQLLLKGKLQQVLEAQNTCCPPPHPVCPPPCCPPLHPVCPPSPPCIGGWAEEKRCQWCCGSPLLWKHAYTQGKAISWQGCSSACVYLAAQHTYFSSFTFHLRSGQIGAARIQLGEIRGSGFHPIASYEACVAKPDSIFQISGCTVLAHDPLKTAPFALQFVLDAPQSVFVERAEWNIVSTQCVPQ